MCEALTWSYIALVAVLVSLVGALARQAGKATGQALRRYVEHTCRQERSDDQQPHQPES